MWLRLCRDRFFITAQVETPLPLWAAHSNAWLPPYCKKCFFLYLCRISHFSVCAHHLLSLGTTEKNLAPFSFCLYNVCTELSPVHFDVLIHIDESSSDFTTGWRDTVSSTPQTPLNHLCNPLLDCIFILYSEISTETPEHIDSITAVTMVSTHNHPINYTDVCLQMPKHI